MYSRCVCGLVFESTSRQRKFNSNKHYSIPGHYEERRYTFLSSLPEGSFFIRKHRMSDI